jgi:hypothetical protein
MKTTKKVISLQEKVEILLTKYPQLRDDDKLLVTKMWFFEMKKLNLEPNTAPTNLFFNLYQQGSLTNSDIITRARRKVQEMKEELRGTTWDERHKEGDETRLTIK